MSRQVEKSLLDIDFAAQTRGPFTPSSAAWEDQVLHRISGDGVNYGHPHCLGDQRMRSLVCWARVFLDQETLVVLNTDESEAVTACSTVTPLLRVDGDEFYLMFWHAPAPEVTAPAGTLTMEHRAGLPTVRMTRPPAGFAIYQAAPALHRLGPHPQQDLKPWVATAWHGGIRQT